MELLFPHKTMRRVQQELVADITATIQGRKRLIAHAPTGMGKTAAVLSPAAAFAVKQGLQVFFLTSRHTQHKIAIETLQELNMLYKGKLHVVDMIGKKFMCARPEAATLYSSEFPTYCKKLRDDDGCEQYLNTRKGGKATKSAEQAVEQLITIGPMHSETSVSYAKQQRLCPYEVAVLQAKLCNVTVADYNYMFNPAIRDSFLKKTSKELEQCIVIVDEAHNLPERVRHLLSSSISSSMIRRGMREAEEWLKLKGGDEPELLRQLMALEKALEAVAAGLPKNGQKLVGREEFLDELRKEADVDVLVSDLEFVGDDVLEQKKVSYLHMLSKFLTAWRGQDEGFARIAAVKQGLKGTVLQLSYKCLDPSLVISEVVERAHSIICMSGTLKPAEMYRDVLGFKQDAVIKEYPNPFPAHNKLSLIVPDVTTKFTARSAEQYKKIAQHCADITNAVPGNSIIFFPSYDIRDKVQELFYPQSRKTVFLESKKMGKKDKFEMLERFKEYKENGAVLMAVSSANFAEGIDLPGLLKCVVVVGLPLQVPDMETKELIQYYDKKFGKGWDYGYVLPAMTKCMQNAGRCIRSETDRGIIFLLDERYLWKQYARCFPQDWNIKMSRDYVKEIRGFFGNA